MSSGAKAAIGVGAIVVAVALFIVLQGSESDDDSDSTTPVATSTTETSGGDNAREDREQRPDKPEEPEEPSEPEIPTIEVKGGQVVGGVAELEFDQGDEIVFKVTSDVADHVHLHGYDVFKDVAAGDTITMRVPATITGGFEAELEDSVIPIAEITVNPG
jgi:hypothetical protein